MAPEKATRARPGLSTAAAPRRRTPQVLIPWAVAVVVPLAWLAVMVDRLGVNVPFWDEWALIPVLRDSYSGHLHLGELWAQHNEHRLFFPRLVLVGLAHLTHWDLRADMFASVVLAGVTLLVLVVWLRASLNLPPWILVAAAGLFALFVVSPIQYENWLWGWQLQWYLCDLAAIAAIALLSMWPATRSPRVGVALAVVAAVVASYSLASGLLVWLACLVVFIPRRHLRRYLPAWVVAGALTIGGYLVGFYRPSNVPPVTTFLHKPFQFLAYVLRYIGGPLFGFNSATAVVGFLILGSFLAATVFLARREPEAFSRAIGWVALGAWSLLGACLTAVGRVGFGVAQSEASRYTTASMLLLLSTVALLLACLGTASFRKVLPAGRGLAMGGVALVLVAGLVANYHAGLAGMDGTHQGRLGNVACLQQAQGPEDSCLGQSYPGGGLPAWRLLQYLRQHHLAGA